MNKKVISLLIITLFMVIGSATVITTWNVNTEARISFDESDFNSFFSKIIDGEKMLSTISEDGDSFTYTSTGSNIIDYYVINRSMKYDAIYNVECNHDVLFAPENEVVSAGTVETGKISTDYEGDITCELKILPVEKTEIVESNPHILTLQANGGTIDTNKFYYLDGYPIGKLPVPEKEGYKFLGWYNVDEDDDPRSFVEITEDRIYNYNSNYVTIFAHYEKVENNLFELMKNNSSSTNINFSVRSGISNTNGIYTTTLTEGNVPVYYYRGNVNNNIIFNNMCWKIIRTTETGGIKIIYNGIPTNGTCISSNEETQIGTSKFNSNYNDNAYAGYMYGTIGSTSYSLTHTNTNESVIKKTVIDPWFNTNFSSAIRSKLEDTVFCNDRSVTTNVNTNITDTYGTLGAGATATLYGSVSRASYYTINPSPSLVCKNQNDKFTVSTAIGNGKLTYPVGLITLDEAIFAGYNTVASGNNYRDTNYLNSGNYYWTMSPIYMYNGSSVDVGIIDITGTVFNAIVTNSYGVRPVISLVNNTIVTGAGTSTNPYIVK